MSWWSTMPGKLVHVSVGGPNIWGVNANGDVSFLSFCLFFVLSRFLTKQTNKLKKVYRLVENIWQQVAGKMKLVSAAADGTVWSLSAQGEIFVRDAVQWTRLKGDNDVRAATLSVGSKSAVWCTDADGTAFRWTGRSWVALDANTKLQSISVGEDGAAWAITKRLMIVKFNAEKNVFETVPGKLAQIAVGKKDDVWGVSNTQKVFRWDAKKARWTPVAGKLAYVSAFEGDIWGLGADHAIYRHKTEREEQQRLREAELKAAETELKAATDKLALLKTELEQTKSGASAERAKLEAELVRAEKNVAAERTRVTEKVRVIAAQEAQLKEKSASIAALESEVKSQVTQKLAALATTASVETQWEVDVYTGSLRGAGTDAVGTLNVCSSLYRSCHSCMNIFICIG